jgi:hypothetical protein
VKKRIVLISLVVIMMLTLLGLPSSIVIASPSLVTADLNSGLTPEDLVAKLLGPGITVSNVTYNGANCAAGTFSGGTGIIGFEEGIVLSSGDIALVVGPNNQTAATKDNGYPGDTDLDTLIPGYTTFDAAVLEFDFIPTTNLITFDYVFGSEEYNEYANTLFNNVFGFFVNGVNAALLPDGVTPVSINNVNGGNPIGNMTPNNPVYFIDNDPVFPSPCYGGPPGGVCIDTQLDGLTVVLTVIANVNPYEKNHIKLAISDAGDSILDSDVFIKAGSFTFITGFVTGGGWIYSDPGAYRPDPSLEGKANFGFVSKYQKKSNTPVGQTEFNFNVADLNFHSSSYEWLLITGKGYAMFKGSGTINGMGDYKFMLWAGDGVVTDSADTFRIRIWEEDEFGVETDIYDNGFDQDIGGGSIVIHTKK